MVEIAKNERRSLSKQVELLLERCLERESRGDIAAPTMALAEGTVALGALPIFRTLPFVIN
jgi:hypothetical protein